MKELKLWVQCAPIAFIAIFGGTALILCNPGYFWDDWVWLYQQPADNIQIGKELGIFWAGYLTNAINTLPAPSLTMRVVALVAWIIAGAAFAYVLYRQRKITSHEAFQLFLLYSASHVAPIRFLTSVAMYNVYIATFWIGCAILLCGTSSRKLHWWSLPFFFFSFYLNSVIVLYGLLIALLAIRYLAQRIEFPTFSGSLTFISRARQIPQMLREILRDSKMPLLLFSREYAILIALPVVFVLIKHFTTVPSLLYGNYNDIDHRRLISGILNSFELIRPVLRDFFAISSRHVRPLVLVICGVICFLLLRLIPRPFVRTTLRTAVGQMFLGLLIFAAGVYPYILVDKAPNLTNFYDSRNILPAMPGLVLILLSFVNILDLGFASIPVLRRFGRDLLLGYILGASIGSGIITGLDLWRDWMRQTAIMSFLETHKEPLAKVRTFVFKDAGPRVNDRMIWNYEYTGNLIAVYRTRDRFGISVDEYSKWPPGVELLSNRVMKERFNIKNYDFTQPHAIITLASGPVPLTPVRVLETVKAYLLDKPWQQRLLRNYFQIDIAYEFVETEQRVTEIYQMASALAAYHLKYGHYPATSALQGNGVPMHEISPTQRLGPSLVSGDIPGLFPDYMSRPKTMSPRSSDEPHYLYSSDGIDFKLIYANPPDLAYAKQVHPALIDPVRPGYGIWTLDAEDW